MILSRFLQFFICSTGISFFVWAYVDPQFRNIEGFLQGEFCLPIAVGMALIIFGLAGSGRLKRAAFWFALALVGQAVALQMIDAGPFIRYQHYKSFDHLLIEMHPLVLIFLAVQTAFVVAGLRIRWLKIRAWLGRTFKTWQLLGVALVFFLSSATVSSKVPIYVTELFFAAFVQTVNLGNIVLMVWALPEETVALLKQRLERLFGQHEKGEKEGSGSVYRFAVPAAIWVTVFAAILSFFVYERHPHVQDEVIYYYHAHYLADGVLSVPASPVPDAFSLYMIPYEADRWYSIFPVGWPAMLALGVLLGVPWLVNPILAGLNVLLIYMFIREIYSRYTACVSVILLCTSPWYIFMAMNFMSHTFTLTCALFALLALARAMRTGKSRWAWLAGCAVGMVSLIRLMDGIIVAGLLGMGVIGIGGLRLRVTSLAAFVIGIIMVGAIVLPYNKLLTGDATKFPLMAYYEQYFGHKTNAIGFGPERGLGWPIDPFPGHSPIESIINANLNTFSVNIELLGWSTGSLIFLTVLLFSGVNKKREYLMFATIAAIIVAYSFYWFSGGPDFGARYWYLMLIPLVVLTVRGIQFLGKKFENEQSGSPTRGTRVIVVVLSLCMFTLVNYFPWRAIEKYHHYLGMRPDMKYLAKEYGFGKSLVLIRGNRFPDYASAWVYNPLNPYADAPVYAWDQNSVVRAQLLKAYPDRPVWIVDGPSITHCGFKVVEGPLSASELIVNKMKGERLSHDRFVKTY
ncbi:MAG: glycosyltransferase family 39 protein [Candidatus Hodarchaeota archaeon]